MDSTISTSYLLDVIDKLKSQRIKESTRKIYYCVWRKFNEFFIKLDHKPSTWEQRITLFVGYFIDQKKQSQTVCSYVSALKGVLAEVNIFLDKDQFLLSALTRACKFKNDHANMRLPIRKGMLNVLIRNTADFFLNQKQPYLATLYCALFSTAYFGLFRVGELTSGSHPVLATNVHLARNKKKLLFILITSKTHGVYNRPQSIKITSMELDQSHKISKSKDLKNYCPYELLRQYLEIRPKYRSKHEQFFVFRDNSAVGPSHMRNVLKAMLQMGGFDHNLYNCQSL